MLSESVFVHIVCYHSSSTIELCIAALLKQEGYTLGENLHIRVTDNNELLTEEWALLEKLKADFPHIVIERLEGNLGFAAGHNLGMGEFIRSRCKYALILNPDLALSPDALGLLVRALEQGAANAACPVLLRADADLKPIKPSRIDGYGMVVTAAIRHLDAYAGMDPAQVALTEAPLFGASGAAVLLSRTFIQTAALGGGEHELDSEILYPQLSRCRSRRVYLFDEAFFAYREDADLAWRARLLGLITVGVPEALGYHVRRVTPERRAKLPSHINRWSVRNRFLLIMNNAFQPIPLRVFLKGMLLRNLVVVLGVLIQEWGSLPALRDLWVLRRRVRERRKALRARIDGQRIEMVWSCFK